MKHWIMKSQPEEMKSIELDLSDDVLLKLAMQAHERNVTLNTHIIDVIKDKIKDIPKQFIAQLVEKKFLENLKKNLGKNKKIFKKGDILEFTIFMKDPKIKLLSNSEKMTKKYNNSEKKYKIGNSFWNIYFIIL